MTIIRALTINDLSQVQALADASQREGFRFVRRFADEMPVIALDAPTQWFLGVFDAHQLCAIGGVTPDPYADDARIGRIRRVYVVSILRRHGYGSELLLALEARARGVYPILRLSTDTPAAAAFYERRGYTPTTDAGATHIRAWPVDHSAT
jgi:GNAT superfamily N-acetyltransferase